MSTYSSTTLNMLDRYCPRALDYAEAHDYRDRDVFQAGISAHAILQAVGESMRAGEPPDQHAIAESVVRELVTVGRAFNKRPEPPMSPEMATAGRQIALRYLAERTLSPTAQYEAGLAVDQDWKPVDYSSKDAYYRAAIDVIDVIESVDEDGYATTMVITQDWKSAWNTDASECDTIQLKGQSALALAHYPNATVLRRRAVNLRTGLSFDADTIMDDEGRATVEQWRKDIGHAIAAAEVKQADGKRPARPGAACYGCPYLERCDSTALPEGDTPQDLAMTYMLIEAMRADLLPKLKLLAKDEPIETKGGIVGYIECLRKTASPDAPRKIAEAWFGPDADDKTIGLLTALKLGSGNCGEMAKTLHPFNRSDKEKIWKASREALDSALIIQVPTSSFEILKSPD